MLYIVIFLQRWARTYRDDQYHAAVETNNGTEAMNKLMKYRYLPRQKNITLSNLTSKIVEEFVPALHYKYIFMNFRQTSLYRTYNPSVVPAYLQGRPRTTILHCLHRKASSNKFSSNDIHDVDRRVGVFEVHGKSQTYRVDFGSSTGMPSCTCRDWQNYHIPCKHFFGVFQNKEDWTWDKLPDAYLKSEYLSLDESALTKYLSTASGGTGAKFTSACTHSIASPSLEESDKTLPVGSDFDELPKKVVYTTILSSFYIVTHTRKYCKQTISYFNRDRSQCRH